MNRVLVTIALVLLLLLWTSPALAEVRVRFDANGGTSAPATIYAEPDGNGVTRFVLPDEVPTRSGYRFIGWSCEGLEHEYPLDPPGKSIAFSVTSGTLSYIAQWTPIGGAESCPYVVADMTDLRGDLDVLQVDFKCIQDEEYTYWAVHSWYGDHPGAGYAGFQHTQDGYVVILSIWDTGSSRPMVEYAPYAVQGQDFGGEGTGKHVLSKVDWSPMQWYSMRIQAVTSGDRTVYEQWLRPEGGAWQRIAAISVPVPNCGFSWDCAFLEDFRPWSNTRRSYQLKNAFGRERRTGKWKKNRHFNVYNYADQRMLQQNVPYNCVVERTSGGALFLQTGGADTTSCIRLPKELKLPDCVIEPDYILR